jgi:hypothetical protein
MLLEGLLAELPPATGEARGDCSLEGRAEAVREPEGVKEGLLLGEGEVDAVPLPEGVLEAL